MPNNNGQDNGYDDQDASGNSFEEMIARLMNAQNGQNPGAFGRPIDISRLLSRRSHDVLREAGKFATSHGHAEVDALHILRVLVEQHPAVDAIRHAGAEVDFLVRSIEGRLPGAAADAPQRPQLTSSAQRLLLEAAQAARAFGSTYVDPEHLFFALVVNEGAVSGQLLHSVGVTPQSLQAFVRDASQGGTAATAAGQAGQTGRPGTIGAENEGAESETPTLDQYGTDLTARAAAGELDPVIGRADEIQQAIEILLRRTKNNPVLIGEPGVGKTAIVEGLAQEIADGDVPEALRGKRVVSLDLAGMLAGTRYRGDFEERLTKVVDEITEHKDELIVFVDEIHMVVGAGGGGDGAMDAGNILKPRLARGDLHLIGATTLKEYRTIEKDAALERRFQPVQVPEPSVDDATRILTGLAPRYEEHHGVTYDESALRAAVEMSHRYISDRFLPDKAIDLIDQAGARRRLRLGSRVDTSALQAQLADLEVAKNQAVASERYEDASHYRDEIEAVEARLAAATQQIGLAASISNESTAGQDAVITSEDIAEMIARATGIPASRLTEGDRSRLGKLESELHQRVVGQDDAVTAIAKSVRRNRTGMGDPDRPTGSFLFLGPTGVGKTELAKALAESLFGDENPMIRLDMSEYGERHTVSRLVGSPPGYVGYDEAGQLTERVRRNPYSVILLDEIEKAHPDVFNLLLQVLDDGRLTDAQGRTVDFRNTVVVMTSNLGSEFLASRSGALGFTPSSFDGSEGNGFGSDKALRDRVMGKLREAMRPEFLNRIDEIVLFRKLTHEQLRSIVSLMLGATAARLATQEIAFSLDDAAADLLVEHGYEPEFGARPLRRVIQREVDDRVAELLVSGELAAGGRVTFTAVDGALVATADAPAAVAA